ncbi:MAG TPA: NADPH:quinone reductase [Propionibacteriaceae bacterium]
MSRAITYDKTGPSSVLSLVDRQTTEPGPGQVRVKVVVSGVNPTDWKARQGGADSKPLPTPQVPNQDGSGVVVEVGADVTGLEIGQRVWLWDVAWQNPEGTAQEHVTLPARKVVTLPDQETFDTGASLGIPALTAHRALTAHEGVPAQLVPGALTGIVVLVTGGAGAVGHAAIQLAVWAGATVITTVSGDEKAELARRAGAEHVINYRTESVAERVKAVSERGVDLVVEVAPLANLDVGLEVLAPNGTIAVYVSESDEPLPIPVRPSMIKNVRFQFIMTYTVTDEQKSASVAAVSAALADGALRVGDEHGLPLTRFALADTAQAHDAVEQATVGKVLIDI